MKVETTFREAAREIPLCDTFDVLVCGAGPAGVMAAIAAGRMGVRVGLLEQHGSLGGIWTTGCLAHILDARHGGLLREVRERMLACGALHGEPDAPRWDADPEILRRELEAFCAAAGVRVRLYTRVCAAHVDEQRRLRTVITESKSGREAWSAAWFIDATGDGDLGFQAGCGFDIGQPGTGRCQPMTLCALVSGMPPENQPPFAIADRRQRKAWILEEIRRGGHEPSYSRPVFHALGAGHALMMANHEYGYRGPDADLLTTATVHARAENLRIVAALRSLGGAWSALRVVAQGAQIGIRESRRLHGLYTLTPDDLRHGARFDDAVCRVHFGVDVHALDPGQHRGIETKPFEAKPYDIPLRALIAKDVAGLMMAGRCISGSFEAHASYRVSGDAAALGEAAGTAAALAVKQDIPVQEVPLKLLRAHLPPLDFKETA